MTGHVNGTVDLGGNRFTHRMVLAAGIRFHCVEGGARPPVILMAGFPQSWYAWRRVMPILVGRYTTIAIDLPGQGDSDRPTDG
jgi:pimeloyl-ACP methyl ester carboxylesterase